MGAHAADPQSGAAARETSMRLGWTPDELPPHVGKAFRYARRVFLHGDRLDMSALADQLDISRVTLYRWFGRRETLLVKILWSMTLITMHDRTEQANARGWNRMRVPDILSGFVMDALATPGLRSFLRAEGDLALRILTTPPYGYQPAMLTHITSLLADDVSAGSRDSDEPLAELAFASLRMVESYIHLQRITGEEPDASRADTLLHTLLR